MAPFILVWHNKIDKARSDDRQTHNILDINKADLPGKQIRNKTQWHVVLWENTRHPGGRMWPIKLIIL